MSTEEEFFEPWHSQARVMIAQSLITNLRSKAFNFVFKSEQRHTLLHKLKEFRVLS